MCSSKEVNIPFLFSFGGRQCSKLLIFSFSFELHMQRLRVKFSTVEIIKQQGGSDDDLQYSALRETVSHTPLFIMMSAIRQIIYTLERYSTRE